MGYYYDPISFIRVDTFPGSEFKLRNLTPT